MVEEGTHRAMTFATETVIVTEIATSAMVHRFAEMTATETGIVAIAWIVTSMPAMAHDHSGVLDRRNHAIREILEIPVTSALATATLFACVEILGTA